MNFFQIVVTTFLSLLQYHLYLERQVMSVCVCKNSLQAVGPRTCPCCPRRVWPASVTGKSISACQNRPCCPGRAWTALTTGKSTNGCRDLPHCPGKMWITPPTRKSISKCQELPAIPEACRNLSHY